MKDIFINGVESRISLTLFKSYQTVNELFYPFTYLSSLVFTSRLQLNFSLYLIALPYPPRLINFLPFKTHLKSDLLQKAISDYLTFTASSEFPQYLLLPLVMKCLLCALYYTLKILPIFFL